MNTASTNQEGAAPNLTADNCSQQVRTLYGIEAAYTLEVDRLWRETEDEPGPRELRRRGYGYLVTLFYEIARRSRNDGRPMSPEFRELAFFCRYVGPRTTVRHSLHRMNNSRGYCTGNVEWADKRKQSEVRRTTQFHLYLGRRHTDRELSEVLTAKGLNITAAAIKKTRQRLSNKGVPPSEITAAIMRRLGLPYESSADPIEAWDFPPEFRERLSVAYQAARRPYETRLHYYIRWLTEKQTEYQRLRDDPLTTKEYHLPLGDAAWRYGCLASWAKEALKQLHENKIKAIVDEIVPGYPHSALP